MIRRAFIAILALLVFAPVAQAAASWSASDAVTLFHYSRQSAGVVPGWPVSATVQYGPGLVAPNGEATLVADGNQLGLSCRGNIVFRVGQSAPHRRLARLLHCQGGASATVSLLVKPSAGHRYGAGFVESGETIWPSVASS